MSGPLDVALQAQAQRLAAPLLPLLIARDRAGGAWTPTLIGTGATPGAWTYSAQVGVWHRQGPMVYIACRLTVSGVLTSPTSANLRIVGLPPFLPTSNDASDVRVGPINNVALSASRLGLTARIINEAGQPRIELREYGSNVGAAQYTTALLASSSGFDIGVAGWYLAEDALAALVVAPTDELDFGDAEDIAIGIAIGVI